jgi:hypothetical protein
MWRVIIGADGLVCLLQIIFGLLGVLKESPKYWLLRGEKGKAEATLKWLRHQPNEKFERGNEKVDIDLVNNDHQQNNDLVNNDQQNNDHLNNDQQPLGLYTLIRTRFPQVYKSLGLVFLLHLGQQLSGVNAIFYFSSLMFPGSVTVPILIALLNLLMTIVSLLLMDRAGRRPLFLISVAGMILSYLLFTLSLYSGREVLKAASILAFIASFALGMGPVPWLMLGEVFTPWSVSAGVSLGVSVNWISNFVVVAIFQLQLRALGKNVMLPYLTFLLIIMVWAARYLPETKGRAPDLLS